MSVWGSSRCCGAGAQPRVSLGRSGGHPALPRASFCHSGGWCPQEAFEMPSACTLSRLGVTLVSVSVQIRVGKPLQYETGSEEEDGQR